VVRKQRAKFTFIVLCGIYLKGKIAVTIVRGKLQLGHYNKLQDDSARKRCRKNGENKESKLE